MGYYCKRYITVVDGGQENLQKLRDIISENNEYDWDNIVRLVDVGILSDCNNNFGDGTKWYSFDNDITNASERLGDVAIYVLEISEDDKLAEYYLNNGLITRYDIEDKGINYKSDIHDVTDFVNERIRNAYK